MSLTNTAADVIKIDRIMAAAETVQPLPATVIRLLEVLGGDDWDLTEVVEIVACDQALAAQVLRTANSALCGAQARIDRVEDAVMRIGPAAVLTFSIARSLRRDLIAAEEALWRRSVAASVTVEAAARARVGGKAPAATQATALLHDFGRLALLAVAEAADRGDEIEIWPLGSVERQAAEREVYGLDHAEVGGLLARSWHLPVAMVRGIACHHRPDEQEDLLVDLVHLAATLAGGLEEGRLEGAFAELAPGARRRLGLDRDAWERLGAIVAGRLDEVLLAWGG